MNHWNPTDETRFLRQGRYDPDDPVCRLYWSGSGLRCRMKCTYMTVEASLPEGPHTAWLGVEVDDAPVARFALLPGRHTYPVLSGLDGETPHEITLLRDTQPTDEGAGAVTICAIETDGEPIAARPKPLMLEFIGDSLTVGEGTLGPVSAQEWRMAWISHLPGFAAGVARRMNAERRVIALGGWGVWRAWDTNEQNRIGRIYDRLCAVVPEGDVPYDFSRQRAPDAVIVNLGTNDAGAYRQLTGAARESAPEQVTRRAVELLEQVRAAAPEAWILWAYGLCGDALSDSLRAAVEERRAAGDARVRYVPLTDCGSDLGARSHPGRAAHQRAADEICAALRACGIVPRETDGFSAL